MLSKITLAVALISIGLAVTGVLGARLEILPPSAGLGLFALGGLLGFAALGCGVAVIFVSQSFGVALVAMLGVLPLIALVAVTIDGFKYPAINDISTDLESPPEFVHAPALPANEGRDMAFPDAFKPVIAEHYPGVQPKHVDWAPERAYQQSLATARSHPHWEITRDDEEALSFEGVAVTPTFRWRDDFIVRITPANDGGSRIDMRSKSREGRSDMGANARRIRDFFTFLEGGQPRR